MVNTLQQHQLLRPNKYSTTKSTVEYMPEVMRRRRSELARATESYGARTSDTFRGTAARRRRAGVKTQYILAWTGSGAA